MGVSLNRPRLRLARSFLDATASPFGGAVVVFWRGVGVRWFCRAGFGWEVVGEVVTVVTLDLRWRSWKFWGTSEGMTDLGRFSVSDGERLSVTRSPVTLE